MPFNLMCLPLLGEVEDVSCSKRSNCARAEEPLKPPSKASVYSPILPYITYLQQKEQLYTISHQQNRSKDFCSYVVNGSSYASCLLMKLLYMMPS